MTTTAVRRRFPTISEEMMLAVDKADSAQFSRDEILAPTDWVLLNYLMDSRTGLGRFQEVPGQQLPVDDGPDRLLPQPRY
jgi:hypothetical protein